MQTLLSDRPTVGEPISEAWTRSARTLAHPGRGELSEDEQWVEIPHHCTFIPFELDPRRVADDQIETASVLKQVSKLKFPV